MRDAVGLIGKTVQIKETTYKIKSFHFVPSTNRLYVGLEYSGFGVLNYDYKDLLPYLVEQIKL
jgi:hypothetical protein